MFKKLAVSVAALGLYATALANGGIVTSTAIASSPISDFNSGVYLGVQGGYGVSGWKNVNGDSYKVSDADGFAGRLLIGYDFTKNWAIEAGFLYIGSNAKIKNTDGTVLSDIRTQALDLVVKGKIPVADNFDIYAKLGPGYLMSKGLRKAVDSDGDYLFSKDNPQNLALVFGVGADYYFMPNLWLDLSWTGYLVNSKFGNVGNVNFDKYKPNANFYALGLYYKFNF